MSNREIVIWLIIILIFNPVFTHLFFVRRLKVTRKGKAIIYAIGTAIAVFWCGISTRYFILSVIAATIFGAVVVLREITETFLLNKKSDDIAKNHK